MEAIKRKTRLQDERESRGLSQTRLAGLARLHPSDISRIEGRRALPANYQRVRLARALRVPHEWLFEDFPERIALKEVGS